MPPHIDPFGRSLRLFPSNSLRISHHCLTAHGELVGSARAATGQLPGSTHGYLVSA